MGINRRILNLAIPSILANITVPIVGMVDLAVAGHLDPSSGGTLLSAFQGGGSSAAALIGGIAVGSMLFDLLYWNFGFLRVGTGGLTAQACGRDDMQECGAVFFRSVGIALLCSLVLLAVQWLFIRAAFLAVDCTPEVRSLASQYFFIRIWAAPATLSLMAFKGWFIGMQDGVSPMVTDLVVNVMNTVLSIVLALGFEYGGISYEGTGFPGIALGTVIAQYMGLATAVLIVFFRYRRRVFSGFSYTSLAGIFRGGETRRFFSMNADLFVRSLCFIGIYIGFTTLAAHFGDLVLASGSILMKIMMLFSYFTDGFAYAGEALSGKYIGKGDRRNLADTVKYVFIWSMGIGILFILVYAFAGKALLSVMTSDAEVMAMASSYLPWLLLMPLAGCAAFTWDGIYIGATASRTIRNAMIWAVAGFFLSYVAGMWITGGGQDGTVALHVLMAAYFVHLLVRTVHLSFRYRTAILGMCPSGN